MNEITVIRAGPLTTVQDRGRAGFAHLGVPPSGAADSAALALGNRLVGNAAGAAGLEATLHGPVLRFAEPVVVAVTGAGLARTAAVEAGELLDVGRCRAGVRAYVCVRGGIAVETTLGSRSHDLLTGLGPPPLRDGDVLPIGTDIGGAPEPVDVAPPPDEPVLHVVAGPRNDWFPAEAFDLLTTVTWRVAAASNRVGIRLEGPALPRLDRGELLSEGLVGGAIQVTPSGQPILLGPDHPTTGGYPVIAVVRTSDLPLAGQLGPGATVRFTQ
jgi:biotin-dependent carboxylase-like uncharacterized protein